MLDVLSPEGAAVSHDTTYLARNGVSTHQGDTLVTMQTMGRVGQGC